MKIEDIKFAPNQFPATDSKGELLARTITDFILKLAACPSKDYLVKLLNAANGETKITGEMSCDGGGDLTDNRAIRLKNDLDKPPIGSFYGVNKLGVRGFHTAEQLNNMPCSNSKRYFDFSYSGTSPKTYAFYSFIAPFDGNLKNLRVYFKVDVDESDYDFVSTKNGVAQLLSVKHTAGSGVEQKGKDLSHVIPVLTGDTIGFYCETSSNNNCVITASMELEEA